MERLFGEMKFGTVVWIALDAKKEILTCAKYEECL